MNAETTWPTGGKASTYRCTERLRILRPRINLAPIGLGTPDRLQQAWVDMEKGNIDWRDVEVVLI